MTTDKQHAEDLREYVLPQFERHPLDKDLAVALKRAIELLESQSDDD